MNHTILVLGAGTGGLVAAKELSVLLRKQIQTKSVRILVFEKESKFVFAPSLLWVMVGKRTPSQIYTNTSDYKVSGTKLIIGELQAVDPVSLTVRIGSAEQEGPNQDFTGTYMIVALGAEQAAQHGMSNFGHDLYTLSGATNLYAKLKEFKGGKIALVVPSLPFKCPAAPYEAAMLINDYIHKSGLSGVTEISLFTPEVGPMGVAGADISNGVSQLITSKGIKYFPQHTLSGADKSELHFSNGMSSGYDLLAFTPTHICPRVVRNSPLVSDSGWIDVDRHTFETEFKNVYAIGDVTNVPLEMGKPLPKAGVFAHGQAKVVAQRIASAIIGRPTSEKFDGFGQCFLETGAGKAGYAKGDFYASPAPSIKMKSPGFTPHWLKIGFEKYWFYKYLNRIR